MLICVFFFFQAEDGIRDLTVTGVQTCALPISCAGSGSGDPQRKRPRRAAAMNIPAAVRTLATAIAARSEERRVGKECRSRGARYHQKKKEKETLKSKHHKRNKAGSTRM